MSERILYLPQLSMRSYVDSSWLLGSASQLVRMTAQAHAMGDEHEWMWLLPESWKCDPESESELSALSMDNVRARRVSWGDDVRDGRYYFPLSEICEAIDDFEPTVVLNEVPEHGLAWRQAFSKTGALPKLVTFVVHVERAGRAPTMLGQVSGIRASDHVLWQSERERELFRNETMKLVKGALVYETPESVWTGLFTPDEADTYKEQLDQDDTVFARDLLIPMIFYAGRLSDPARTRHDLLRDALYEIKRPYDLRVANPNGAAIDSWGWVGAAELPDRSRRTYFDFLWNADIVPVLWPNTSIGICEAAVTGNLLVTVPEQAQGSFGPITTATDAPGEPEISDALNHAIDVHAGGSEELQKATRELFIERHAVETKCNMATFVHAVSS